MKTNTITLTGYTARTERAGPLILGTSGSCGNEHLRVQRGAGWEGLNIRVVFHPCGAELLVPEDGALEVPWEATARPLARGEGRLVFQGASEERVVNTADLFYEVHSHSPAEGALPQERTPVLSEELLKRVYEIDAAAESSAQSARSASDAADRAQAAAEIAQAAAQKATEASGAAAQKISVFVENNTLVVKTNPAETELDTGDGAAVPTYASVSAEEEDSSIHLTGEVSALDLGSTISLIHQSENL